jgi:hypothetical protein
MSNSDAACPFQKSDPVKSLCSSIFVVFDRFLAVAQLMQSVLDLLSCHSLLWVASAHCVGLYKLSSWLVWPPQFSSLKNPTTLLEDYTNFLQNFQLLPESELSNELAF